MYWRTNRLQGIEHVPGRKARKKEREKVKEKERTFILLKDTFIG
jgi:hypothetical protein